MKFQKTMISKFNSFYIKKNSNYISGTVVNDAKQHFTCEDELNQKFNSSFKIDSSKMFFHYPYFDCGHESLLNDDKSYVLFDRPNAFLENNIEPYSFNYQQSIGLEILDL